MVPVLFVQTGWFTLSIFPSESLGFGYLLGKGTYVTNPQYNPSIDSVELPW